MQPTFALSLALILALAVASPAIAAPALLALDGTQVKALALLAPKREAERKRAEAARDELLGLLGAPAVDEGKLAALLVQRAEQVQRDAAARVEGLKAARALLGETQREMLASHAALEDWPDDRMPIAEPGADVSQDADPRPLIQVLALSPEQLAAFGAARLQAPTREADEAALASFWRDGDGAKLLAAHKANHRAPDAALFAHAFGLLTPGQRRELVKRAAQPMLLAPALPAVGPGLDLPPELLEAAGPKP